MWQYYPTGFRSPLLLEDKKETAPDADLVEFMRKSKAHLHSISSWSTRRDFYEIAKRLYGDFGAWLDAQDSNPDISQTAYDMIYETLRYIETGRRPISLATRMAIINVEAENGVTSRTPTSAKMPSLRSTLKFNPSRYMYLWANQEDGFSDMLCVTNFIFGSQTRV